MSESLFRLVPPAGAPVPMRAVLLSLRMRAGGHLGLAKLLKERLGPHACFLVSSGRAALALLLEAMRQQRPGRREVVIPAYTCFSVPSAVVRAGLTVRLCDVHPETLDLDVHALARLDLSRVLCIVPSGLYGLPGDLAGLERVGRKFGAFVVDDAAQCLGATQDTRPCGTFGDAGFFSLGRGKGMTTMGGGILVTRREDLAGTLDEGMRRLPGPSPIEVGAAVGTSLIYSGLLRPSRYWFVDRIPFLGLGGSHFDADFRMTRLSAYQERLAEQIVPLVDAYNKIRRDHADHLRSGLNGAEGIAIPHPVPGTSPVYLRFPILARDGAHRGVLLDRLRQAGISASTSYPTAIGAIPDLAGHLAADQASCPSAESIAARILTLPTHPWVTGRDVERMVALVRGRT